MATPAGGAGAPPPPGPGPAAGTPPKKPDMRGRHPANAYLLYYQEMRSRYRGNMFAIAKECGRRWKVLPWNEKMEYKNQALHNRLIWKANLLGTGNVPQPKANNRRKVWDKVVRRTGYVSKKKKAELARLAAAEEALKRKKDAETQSEP